MRGTHQVQDIKGPFGVQSVLKAGRQHERVARPILSDPNSPSIDP
jgi:hypothetical protein